jgi:nitrous oxidase accessory protein NosD
MPALAATITVNPGESIQAAIDGASTGDTIEVAAGTYNEYLSVNKEVSIVGVGASLVTINVSGLPGSYPNNCGIYVSSDNVSLQGITVDGVVGVNDKPDYGIKYANVSGGSLDNVLVKNVWRSGFDLLGTSAMTISNIESTSNGGHGLSLVDCNDIMLSSVSVHGNGWQGVSVVTWGRYSPIGTSGIVFAGTNNFVDVFQLEQGRWPAGPYEPITFSTDIADGADVTVLASDFTYALWGDDGEAPSYQRVFFTSSLAEAQTAAAFPGPVGHLLTTGRYVQSIEDRSQLYISPGCEIQAAVDAASDNDTVNVAAGTYVGAAIDSDISIQGDPAGGTLINDGVHYGGGHPTFETAFLLGTGSDGTTIEGFSILNNVSSNFAFAVFSRDVDNVTLKNLKIYDTVQGISNWGGSGWSVLDNEIIGTIASGGGGIGIYIGATQGMETCSNNLVQGNVIGSDATAPDYSCPGIVLALDLRWGRYDPLATYDLSGNQIIGNTITDGGAVNGMGIEVGVIVDAADELVVLPATLGAIHDTTIRENTVAGEDLGLYLYNLVGTDIYQNVIANNVTAGIGMWHGSDDNVFRYNSIAGNAFGLLNETGTLVDAALNWWGANNGPSGEGIGTGDAVSTDVIFSPWLGIDPDGDTSLAGVQINSPMLIIVDDIGPEPTGGYLNMAIEGSNDLPYADSIEVRHGTYDASEPITDDVNIYSEVGSAAHTALTGAIVINAADVLLGRLRQGFTINGPISVGAGIDASSIHINWNDIYNLVTNGGTGTLDATFNFWGAGGGTAGAVAIYPILPEPSDTIIGYMDAHYLSPLDAISFSDLLSLGLSPTKALAALDLMRAFGFSGREAAEILKGYTRLTISRALRAANGDYNEFLALLIGYGDGGGGGGSYLGGGGGGSAGMSVFCVGCSVPLQLELVHPITGEPITDAVVSYSVCRTLDDGTVEIVSLGVMTYDGDFAAYTYELDTSTLEPGVYDVYLGTSDGRSRHFQFEVAVY